MKKINIPTLKTPTKSGVRTSQTKYSVNFGEGKLNLFTNHKEAAAFVAEANRALNLFMHEINAQYAELFKMYRHCWFYFFDRAKSVNRLDLERKILASFSIIDSSLNRAIHNTSGPNGNSFAFSFLTGAIDQCLNVAEMLRESLIIRNELVNRYKMEITIEQLKDLRRKIDSFGLSPDRF